MVFAAVVFVTVFHPYKKQEAIYSDGIGYHLWTRAILEGDLSFRRYAANEELRRRFGHRLGTWIRPADSNRSIYQNKYPPGLALLRLPIMAFLVNLDSDQPLISRAEHWASTISAALALLGTCFLCLRACRLLSIEGPASHLANVAIVFGTGLFHYGTFDGCMSHIYSAFLGAFLLWLGVRAVVRRDAILPRLSTALACFFLVLVRNTNLLLIFGLAIAYLGGRRSTATWNRRKILQDAGTIVFGVAAGLALQLGYNYYANGSWVASSYQGESFVWDRPNHLLVLFSYERGLFLYYPIIAVVLIAGLAVRRTRLWTAWFTVMLLTYVGLYGFWWFWTLGDSFGYRGVVEVLPPAIVLLAAALAGLSHRVRWIATVSAYLCMLATLELMAGYWTWRLFGESNLYLPYWRHLVGCRSILWFLYS